MKHILIILSLFNAVGLLAQQSPEKLGDMVFKIYKSSNIAALNPYIATADEALLFAKTLGKNYTKDEADLFREDYVYRDSIFKVKCANMLEKGKLEGIEWNKIVFVENINEVEEYSLSSTDESKTARLGTFSVIFSYTDKKYKLTIRDFIDLAGIYRIIGDSITLSRYND